MDKKSKYSQPSSKGTADAKKSQDVINSGKVFPKTWRRRESSGTACAKNEQQSKKSNVQKAATSFDKRPKPKGQYYGGAKEDTKVEHEAAAAELGSVMAPGSKKQNFNHLLNFHYAPRDPTGDNYNSGHNNRWLPPVQRHKYNKEQFLQANCQFVVKNDGDYMACLADPDTLVDWQHVQQIRIRSFGNLSCPICLYPPIAAKMTRCGHVYCWSCILHYLALSDKHRRNCPICYESVHSNDLKSVVQVTQNQMNIGDRVTLRLMRRERGSLIAVPVRETDTPVPSNFISVSEANARDAYSKLLLASHSDLMAIIDEERLQLEHNRDPHCPDDCFVQQALEVLEQRVSSLRVSPEVAKPLPIQRSARDDENPDESHGALSKFFYFYQAEDGQHLYLHAMNVKMLELQYGNLEMCPRLIWGKILEKEAGSFTEQLRKRMRYLHHLPLTSTFEIAEIELGPPLVTDEILGYFAQQVENREKRRHKRERDERKREKKITAEDNRRMGKFPTPRVHIESHKHFPQWQSQSTGISAPSPTESVASSPPQDNFLDDNDSMVVGTVGPSFAEMLQTKGSRIPQEHEDRVTRLANTSEAYSAPPSYNQSFRDGLTQVPSANSLPPVDAASSSSASNSNNTKKQQKKKKKCKSTVLFATSMSRAPSL